MKNLLGVVFLSLASFTVSANNCSLIENLDIPKEQRVTLQKQCLDASIPTAPETIIEKVNSTDIETFKEKTSIIVEGVTSTIKTTAKDLNIAVNDFVSTPVGMMTTGIIVYHYVGKDFIVWLKDFFFLTIFVIVANVMLTKIRYKFLLKSEETVVVKGLFGNDKKVTEKTYYTWSELDKYPQKGVQFWYITTILLQMGCTLIYFIVI